MVGGVGQIAGEAPVRTGMTLPTGGHDVLPGKVRFRIPGRQDIMRAVAVVAFRRRRIAELGDFAVEGIKVTFGHVLMAAAALVDDSQFEPLFIRAGDGVRAVAVVAEGQGLVRFGLPGKMDAFGKLLVNSVVALGAGFGDMLAIDAGGGVGAGSSRWGVWQSVHMAVTTSPLCKSPLPWMLST